MALHDAHPLRLRIIERVAKTPETRFAPAELAAEFGEPLSNVAYQVHLLVSKGLLARAGTATRRGAIQHYYRADPRLLRA